MSDFIYKSAKQLAQYIQSKQASSSEIVLAHLKQIEKINPVLNAINQVDNERILQAAAEADRLLSNGKLIGPLHGVPISVKDNILTEGIITTSGCKAFSSNIPDRDATVIKRLKAAGAIVLGKTNMPDFAMCWDTDSSAYGKTNNPYDLTKTVGGSSGGEASIIAAGGSPLGIANDGGGSIRLPSHYCGIAGFRPSIGLVPTTGLFPATESGFASGAAGKILSVSPMARFVEDLIYTLPILAGSDNCDPNALGYPLLASSEQGQLKNLRVAYYQHANDATNSSVFKTIKNVASLLAKSCQAVNEHTPPGVSDSWKMFRSLLCADAAEGLKSLLTTLNITEMKPNFSAALQIFSMRKLSINEFNQLWMEWDEYRSSMIKFMQDYDVIICPVTSSAAFSNHQLFTDSDNFASANYLAAYSLMGWPCVVVRAGTSEDGMPIGVQIIAKHWHDYTALSVAQHIEHMLGGWQAPSLIQGL